MSAALAEVVELLDSLTKIGSASLVMDPDGKGEKTQELHTSCKQKILYHVIWNAKLQV